MINLIETIFKNLVEGMDRNYYQVPGTNKTLIIYVKEGNVISVLPMNNEEVERYKKTLANKDYQKEIDNAIENEDYEKAAKLRDERNSLNENSGGSSGSNSRSSSDEN